MEKLNNNKKILEHIQKVKGCVYNHTFNMFVELIKYAKQQELKQVNNLRIDTLKRQFNKLKRLSMEKEKDLITLYYMNKEIIFIYLMEELENKGLKPTNELLGLKQEQFNNIVEQAFNKKS